MSSESSEDSESLDIDSLLPNHEPVYTTHPGRGREVTLLRDYESKQDSEGQSSVAEYVDHDTESIQGAAYQGDSRDLLRELRQADEKVDLVVTSPPFGLRKKKEYGNEDPEDYIDWFLEFADLVYDVLSDEGDFVVDIGGGWEKGEPIRSTYHFELLVDLATDGGKMDEKYGRRYNLAQDFYWYNPAKLPTPAQWVTIERIRVKDAVNHVWWFSKDSARHRESAKPDNRSVLKPYSDAQKDLMENGYNDKLRPSGHDISDKFDNPTEDGAIRPNFWNVIEHAREGWGVHDLLDLAGVSQELRETAEENGRLAELAELALDDEVIEDLNELLPNTSTESPVREIANTRSRTHYLQGCKKLQKDAHPARFPRELPEFFISFLTEPDDLVLDIFGGSNMTGWVAQQANRRWLTFEYADEYLDASRLHFMSMDDIEAEAAALQEGTESSDKNSESEEAISDD